jgi:ATP-dependent protease ClpP protease subunit
MSDPEDLPPRLPPKLPPIPARARKAAGSETRAGSPHWEVLIAGDLTDKQNDLLQELVDVPARSRGTVYFDSCGGSAYTGISLAALMRVRGLRVTGVVLGECSSAALLPFAACERRFVTPQSTLLFHPIRWSSEENITLEEAAEWARHFKAMEADYDKLLSGLLGITSERMRQWTRPGRFVTGPELAAEKAAVLFEPFTPGFDLRRVSTS